MDQAEQNDPKTREAREQVSISDQLARTLLLPGEARDLLGALLNSLLAELRPSSRTELHLIETMAIARWRAGRLLAMQHGTLADAVSQQPEGQSPLSRATLACEALSEGSSWYDQMFRDESRFERQYYRALEEFRRHREWSAKQFSASEVD